MKVRVFGKIKQVSIFDDIQLREACDEKCQNSKHARGLDVATEPRQDSLPFCWSE